jgi:hypothetical protein
MASSPFLSIFFALDDWQKMPDMQSRIFRRREPVSIE